ncbi:MAG: hypothetical protein WDZ35_07705 [Crocinitomicaceae bacterium]
MKKLILILLLGMSLPTFGQAVWINEIHYDNDGGDVNEGFEIAAAAGTDLSCYDIVLYNGNTGALYNTISLSGIVPDNGCGMGTVWFGVPTNGLQNGAPDGIALIDNCNGGVVVQFLSYEGSFTATDGPAAGQTSTDIGVSEGGSDPAGESLQLTGGPGTDYSDFTWAGSGTATEGSTNTGQDFCTSCGGVVAEPTIDVIDDGVSVTCTSATLNWTLGADADNVIVVYSTSPITGTPTDATEYTVGSTIAAGEEVIYNGSGNSTSITGLTSGVTYYYAIFEYNGAAPNCEENYLTGGVSGSFTTVSPCNDPYIQSINYNACTGNEGTDEIIVVQMGDDDIPVDSLVIELPNSTWCNVGCGGNTIVNNPTYINDLNLLAGCTMFTYCDPIPADATLMIFTGNPPSALIDYSASCGSPDAPYCVIFLNNTSLTGNFSNSSTTPRVTTIHFGSGSSSTVSYTASDGVGDVDGATADYDASGNVTYSQNVDCVYPLAVDLTSLTAHNESFVNWILWSTASEENSSHFEIQRSEDGMNWVTIGTVEAARSSSVTTNYQFSDPHFSPGNNYYRLGLVDLNGVKEFSRIVQVEQNSFSLFYEDNTISIGFDQLPFKTYTLNIYDLSGSLLYSSPAENSMKVNWTKSGFFILEIPELESRQKLFTP